MDDQNTAADAAQPATPTVGGQSFVQHIADVRARNRAEALERAVNTLVPAMAAPPAIVIPPAITIPPALVIPSLTSLPATLAEHGPTFREVAEPYIEDVVKIRYNPHTARSIESAFNLHAYPAFGNKPIKQVQRKDIRDLSNEVLNKPNKIYPSRGGCPARANAVFWFLHRFFNWCLDEEIVDKNPCHGMGTPTKKQERERVLNDKEIRWFWWACQEERFPFGAIGRLLLLTGQRRSEIANAEKTQFDREERMLSIPILKTKSRRSHLVPLTDLALEALASVPWIPGRPLPLCWDGQKPMNKCAFHNANERIHARMREFCHYEMVRDGRGGRGLDEIDLPWFTFHDLRRTAATVMCRLGHPIEVVDRLLNHAGGKSGTGRTVNTVTRIYVKHEFMDERRTALQALADHIKKLVGV